MMKSTSWAPIVAIAVVLGLAGIMMVRSFALDARGASGPLMVSGIFRLLRNFIRVQIMGFLRSKKTSQSLRIHRL